MSYSERLCHTGLIFAEKCSTPSNVTVFGYMPVMFMCLGSALWVVVVSLLTRPPSRSTIDKFFPESNATLLPST